MLGWIKIYSHPCDGPPPARALASDTKSKKRKEDIWIEALKTKPIRTALKSLKKQKIVHPNRPSICNFDFLWCRYLVIGVTVHLTFYRIAIEEQIQSVLSRCTQERVFRINSPSLV